ncbi:MAG: amidohydrolase [Chloroflexi bacterium]|nr:amidohydrolase [Chloroflexota bacterium]
MIDTILFNGNIITLDERQPRAAALATAYGRIAALGDDSEVRRLAGPGTNEINLDGKTVLPGLSDAHLHWEWQSRALRSVDVFEVPSKEIALERVGDRAAATPAGEWITGQGWAQDIWADRAFPTRLDLDAVAPENPVVLFAKSGHADWVNSKALELAGITTSTADPEGGQIMRDGAGEATGILLETAGDLVKAAVPDPTSAQLADMMAEAQKQALAYGITMIHDFDDPSCLVSLQLLREQGRLGLRALKHINLNWLDAALETGIRSGFGDDWIRFGALKLFADGALGPKTALMFEPYIGEPENFGMALVDKEEMVEHASRASELGLSSTIHAIGDKAVHDVLDVYEIVRREEQARSEPRTSRRHRIEHVQIIHPQDAGRLAELDIIASMQPIHATSDMTTADRYWGDRSAYAYNPRLQLDHGARIAFGSDAPVEPFNPWLGIHAAVTRQRNDLPAEGWRPEARIGLHEALLGFTQGPAYAAGMEDRLGRLAVGYLADMLVIDCDPYQLPPEALASVMVLGTIVDGKWRHRVFD